MSQGAFFLNCTTGNNQDLLAEKQEAVKQGVIKGSEAPWTQGNLWLTLKPWKLSAIS